MRKIVIKYGLISGAISAGLMTATMLLMSNIMDSDRGYIIGYACMLLAFLVIYFGMASYRDNVGGGQIKYGRALAIGLLITAISSVCYVIAWMILYKTMMPDFMDKYAAHAVERLKNSGASQAEIDKQVTMMNQYKEMYKNPVMVFFLTFIEPLPVGVIVSVISAFIVRMKREPVQGRSL